MALFIFAAGCTSSGTLSDHRDVIFQYSTLSSLVAGVYGEGMAYSDLSTHGNFGVGTFRALDGEMVGVEGNFYQVQADGVAHPVDREMEAPFAVVTHFDVDARFAVEKTVGCEALKDRVDESLPTKNIPYAVKVSGAFERMKTRSVPRQEKPYPPLADVVEEQSVFQLGETEGVMVGFRLPSFMGEANATGYHFHFITASRDEGGHVLGCRVSDVRVEIDRAREWYTVLPATDRFDGADLGEAGRP